MDKLLPRANESLQSLLDILGKASKRVEESAFLLTNHSSTASTEENLEKIDALIMRFLRLGYILIARAIPLIDQMEGLSPVDVYSSLARAESRGLIEHSERLFALPIIRNEFSEEYESYEPELIAPELLALTPSLLKSVERTRVHGISLLKLVN